MNKFCGNCGAEQKPQMDLSGNQRQWVFLSWWKSPVLKEQIASYAICACGIHTNVKGQALLCPRCKLNGVKASSDGEPGVFPLQALYRNDEDICWCRKVPCQC